MTDREAFDRYCHNWFDDESEMQLAWVAWQAASIAAFKDGYEKGVSAFNEAVLLERSKAPQWKDAPDVPGLWLNSINHRAEVVKVWTIDSGALEKTGSRWYGPLPDDGGKA